MANFKSLDPRERNNVTSGEGICLGLKNIIRKKPFDFLSVDERLELRLDRCMLGLSLLYNLVAGRAVERLIHNFSHRGISDAFTETHTNLLLEVNVFKFGVG